MATKSKKLYKSKDGATLGGVCKGISEVYDLDVSIVRILAVVITLFTASSLLVVYFILYLVLPDKTEVLRKESQKFSDDYTINQDDYKL